MINLLPFAKFPLCLKTAPLKKGKKYEVFSTILQSESVIS